MVARIARGRTGFGAIAVAIVVLGPGLAAAAAGNPHLVTVSTNPGGVSNKSTEKNPNTTTYTYKTTGKPA